MMLPSTLRLEQRCLARRDEAELILFHLLDPTSNPDNEARTTACLREAQGDPEAYRDAYDEPMPAVLWHVHQAEEDQWRALLQDLHTTSTRPNPASVATRLVTIVRLLELLRDLVRIPPMSTYEHKLRSILEHATEATRAVE